MDMDDWDVTLQRKFDASAAPRRNNYLREYTPVFRHTQVIVDEIYLHCTPMKYHEISPYHGFLLNSVTL